MAAVGELGGVERGQLLGDTRVGEPLEEERAALAGPPRLRLLLCPQGKFIRIHFGPSGKLASADIDSCECRTGWGRAGVRKEAPA